MNKQQLIEKMADDFFNGSVEQAGRAVVAFISTVTRALVNGEDVFLTGFGTFAVVYKPERNARNPQTGEKVRVESKLYPKFRPGGKLQAFVNGVYDIPNVGPIHFKNNNKQKFEVSA